MPCNIIMTNSWSYPVVFLSYSSSCLNKLISINVLGNCKQASVKNISVYLYLFSESIRYILMKQA